MNLEVAQGGLDPQPRRRLLLVVPAVEHPVADEGVLVFAYPCDRGGRVAATVNGHLVGDDVIEAEVAAGVCPKVALVQVVGLLGRPMRVDVLLDKGRLGYGILRPGVTRDVAARVIPRRGPEELFRHGAPFLAFDAALDAEHPRAARCCAKDTLPQLVIEVNRLDLDDAAGLLGHRRLRGAGSHESQRLRDHKNDGGRQRAYPLASMTRLLSPYHWFSAICFHGNSLLASSFSSLRRGIPTLRGGKGQVLGTARLLKIVFRNAGAMLAEDFVLCALRR